MALDTTYNYIKCISTTDYSEGHNGSEYKLNFITNCDESSSTSNTPRYYNTPISDFVMFSTDITVSKYSGYYSNYYGYSWSSKGWYSNRGKAENQLWLNLSNVTPNVSFVVAKVWYQENQYYKVPRWAKYVFKDGDTGVNTTDYNITACLEFVEWVSDQIDYDYTPTTQEPEATEEVYNVVYPVTKNTKISNIKCAGVNINKIYHKGNLMFSSEKL